MLIYVCKINLLEVFYGGSLLFRAWKVDDDNYCIEHSKINVKLCNLTLNDLVKKLKELNISDEYIKHSFYLTLENLLDKKNETYIEGNTETEFFLDKYPDII